MMRFQDGRLIQRFTNTMATCGCINNNVLDPGSDTSRNTKGGQRECADNVFIKPRNKEDCGRRS
jgi:hypothetical protein